MKPATRTRQVDYTPASLLAEEAKGPKGYDKDPKTAKGARCRGSARRDAGLGLDAEPCWGPGAPKEAGGRDELQDRDEGIHEEQQDKDLGVPEPRTSWDGTRSSDGPVSTRRA